MSITMNTRNEFYQLANLVEETQAAQRTGRLICQKGREKALLYFERGEMVHATYDSLSGEGVLYALLSWNSCTVSFEEKSAAFDYDSSRSLDHQQAILFHETLEYFQPRRTNNMVKPASTEIIEYGLPSKPTPIADLSSLFSTIAEIPPFETSEPPSFGSPPPMLIEPIAQIRVDTTFSSRAKPPQARLLQPPGKVVRPRHKAAGANPDMFLQQMIAQNLSGYLLFSCLNDNQERVWLVLLKQGKVLAIRLNLTDQILSGQAAYDALVQSFNSDMVVSSFESDSKVLEAFTPLLGNEVLYNGQQVTTAKVLQMVQMLVKGKQTAALMLSNRSRTLYYLISEGEAVGCFEVIGDSMQLANIPFTTLVNEDESRLVVLGQPALDNIRFVVAASAPPVSNNPASTLPMSSAKESGSDLGNRFGSSGDEEVEQKLEWNTILSSGRKPYSNLPASSRNFKGLRKSFEQGNCTGIIEISTGSLKLHYLIEKGIPIGLFKLNPQTRQLQFSNVSLFELLDKPDFFFNIYLESKQVPAQQYLDDYLEALGNGTFNRAVEIVQKALRAGMTQETIYDSVFAPAMRQVGVMWEKGKMTVAQEHLATGITEYCRNLVMSSRPNVPEKMVGKVLLTSVSGNNHMLGLNLLGDVFRWHGWEIFPLYSEMPEIEIAEAVFRHQVDLVCLSVSMPSQIIKAINAVKTLRQSGWGGLIEVGGAAFVSNPGAFKTTGADFLGTDAEITVSHATKLLTERAGHRSMN